MLFQNFLKAVFAATIFASPYHDPRNDESNEWSSSPSPITSEDQDEQFQHHLKMFKTFRPKQLSRNDESNEWSSSPSPITSEDQVEQFQHHLKMFKTVRPQKKRQGGYLTSVWNSEPRKLRSGMDDIADELQKQIDQMRQKIKDLEKKEKDASSKPDMVAVQFDISNLQFDLQELYRKVDQLDQSQKQHFKQTIDQLNTEMIKMEINLSDRITALEGDIHKSRINTVIGNIKDGQLETAARTLLNIQDVDIHIEHIINQAFIEKDGKSCSKVLKFIDLIDLKPGSTDWRDKMPTNKVKSLALKTAFRKLSLDIHSHGMSECTFRLAWKANKLQSTVDYVEQESRDNIQSVMLGLPMSVRYLLQETISIRKDSKACPNVDKNILGDYQEWKSESFQKESQQGGDYFYLKEKSFDQYTDMPLEGDGSSVRLGHSTDRIVSDSILDKRLWKPILAANERIQFQNKASGKYLSYENSGSCYEYVLSDKPYDWYIYTYHSD